ncbi:MAG: SIMPL domain-containing protein [Pseudomonadota bacterium]
MTAKWLVLTTLTLMAWAAPLAPLAAQEVAKRTISVSATGTVTAEPNIAVVTMGVLTEAKTAREALSANTKAMGALIDELEAQKIAKKDLQTSNFSVQPRYVYPKRSSDGLQRPPRVVGYTVSNQLTAIVRDLDSLGEVLDKAVSTGSNQIQGLRFSIDKPGPLRDEARKRAVSQAIARAKLLAEAAGVTLGPIMAMSESGGARPPQPVARGRALVAEAASAPVPVARGEQELFATVNITWALQ